MTARKPTLLCSAEAWAFGPAATLLGILGHVGQEIDFIFAGSGTALALASQSSEVFRQLITIQNPVHLADLAIDADGVLSVNDPWTALWAIRRGLPCTYVDILFWYWSLEEVDWDFLRRSSHRLLTASTNELAATLDPTSDIDPVFLGYLWANQVFVQRFSGSYPQTPPDLPIRPVGAIVHCPSDGQRQDMADPLITLSGSLSPLISLNTAEQYCRVVSRILEPSRDALGTNSLVVNPKLIPCVNTLGWSGRSLSHAQMRAAVSACSFLLCPVGLTTVFEAAASRVPMIFLPEQHNVQVPTYRRYAGGKPEDFPELLLTTRCNLPVMGDQNANIMALDRLYSEILNDQKSDLLRALQEYARGCILRFQDKETRLAFAAKQTEAILACVGDFGGAIAIADHIRTQFSVAKHKLGCAVN